MDANTPVTLGMLEIALEQCAESFGDALALALTHTGTEPFQIKTIAGVLLAPPSDGLIAGKERFDPRPFIASGLLARLQP